MSKLSHTIAKTFLGGVLSGAILFAIFMTGPLLGGLAGYVAGLFFGETILGTLNQLGMHVTSMWALGMTLGFVGGFFKAIQTNTTKAN